MILISILFARLCLSMTDSTTRTIFQNEIEDRSKLFRPRSRSTVDLDIFAEIDDVLANNPYMKPVIVPETIAKFESVTTRSTGRRRRQADPADTRAKTDYTVDESDVDYLTSLIDSLSNATAEPINVLENLVAQQDETTTTTQSTTTVTTTPSIATTTTKKTTTTETTTIIVTTQTTSVTTTTTTTVTTTKTTATTTATKITTAVATTTTITTTKTTATTTVTTITTFAVTTTIKSISNTESSTSTNTSEIISTPSAVHQPTMQIWAPIIAVAGTIIVCLLIFFAVRHLRIKADVKTVNQSDYELSYAENQYEQPYRHSVENGTQNEEIYKIYHSDQGSIEYEPYENGEYEEYKIENKK